MLAAGPCRTRKLYAHRPPLPIRITAPVETYILGDWYRHIDCGFVLRTTARLGYRCQRFDGNLNVSHGTICLHNASEAGLAQNAAGGVNGMVLDRWLVLDVQRVAWSHNGTRSQCVCIDPSIFYVRTVLDDHLGWQMRTLKACRAIAVCIHKRGS